MATRWELLAGFSMLLVITFATVGAAVNGYSISGSSAIETPTQEVSFEGQEYVIDSVSRTTAGESVTLTTSAPSGASYDVNLRDPDRQIISSERKTGNATHDLSYFGSGEAGTYAATIEDGGNIVAVYPIVIAGYDVSISPPDDVEAGNEVIVQATATERSIEKHSSLNRVEIVVGNDDVAVKKSMTQVGENTYETTISTNKLSTKTYNVYAVVRGNKTVLKGDEILGISDTSTLTVTDGATPTETSGESPDDGTSGSESEDGDKTSPDDGTSGTESEDGDKTPDDQATTATPPQPTESPISTASDAEYRASPTAAGETTTDGGASNVIEPATSTATPTSSGSGSGFTIGITLAGILAALAIGRYR